MAAGATYTPIATYTISGTSTTDVTFSSFSGYTDLVLIATWSYASNYVLNVQVNADTGANYSQTALYGNGTSAASARETGATKWFLQDNYVSNAGGKTMSIVHFMNYSNTTTYKTMLERSGAASTYATMSAGLWRSTSAITSIKVFNSVTNLPDTATFTLYGIASA